MRELRAVVELYPRPPQIPERLPIASSAPCLAAKVGSPGTVLERRPRTQRLWPAAEIEDRRLTKSPVQITMCDHTRQCGPTTND